MVFEIEDTGIGISPDEHEKVWERFYKVDKTRGNTKKSFGLGLAITKQLVEMHDGEVYMESEPNQGSIFRVFIPTLN